jgi:hypothetical protein
MPKGKTQFQDNWLGKELDGVVVKKWCTAADKYTVRCLLCSETFDISNGGFFQVKSHHKGKKHTLHFKNRYKNKSILDAFKKHDVPKTDGKNDELCHDFQVAKAEALWAMKVAEINMSFRSCTEIVELFKLMFPECTIAKDMHLAEKKIAYVISHGLAKHFDENLKEDIGSSTSKLTIAFDETTNAQVKKQMDIYIKYWSPEKNMVSTRYLTSVFLGHATADIMLKKLLDVFSSFNISLSKIQSLSMDSPNVNKSLLRKFKEMVKEQTSSAILETGFCNLHVASNAFKQFLNSLKFNFDEFATDVHYFMKNSAARREDYKSMENLTALTTKFLLHHVSNRWLTVGPVARRLIEQWPNLCEYFLKFLPAQKGIETQLSNSERYKRICRCLRDNLSQCYLAFIVFSYNNFEKFSLCFQREAPQIHFLYSAVNELIRNVMSQFIQDSIIVGKSGHDLKIVELDTKNSWKLLKDIEIGTRTKTLLTNATENEKTSFRLNARSTLIATTKYLISNLPFCNQMLQDLEVLQPISRKLQQLGVTEGLSQITRICGCLNFPEDMTDKVRDEWKLLNCDSSTLDELNKLAVSMDGSPVRIDCYWREVFNLTDEFERRKYANLAELIKCSLVLPHGNADPERGFSVNNALLVKEKTNLNEVTVRSLRIVKDSVKHHGGIANVPITRGLLSSVKNAHKVYKEYMDKVKEEESREQREKLQKESQEKQTTKRKADLDAKIRQSDAEMRKLRKDHESALALVVEGTNRLNKALLTKNTSESSVAQNLILQGSNELKIIENKLSLVQTEMIKMFKKG